MKGLLVKWMVSDSTEVKVKFGRPIYVLRPEIIMGYETIAHRSKGTVSVRYIFHYCNTKRSLKLYFRL